MTAPVITAGLRDPILQYVAEWEPLNAIVLALTPLQRWQAAGRFNTSLERWFILIGLVAVVVLTVVLLVVSYNQMVQKRKVTDQLFAEYAAKRGLSGREHKILLDVAGKAKLRRSESIFTLDSAFDRGAAKMVEESRAQQGIEEAARLKVELFALCEKLGFRKKPTSSTDPAAKAKKLNSRQIPTGKKLYIKQRKTRDAEDMESTVIENNDTELRVKLTMPVKITFGELWRVRYYFGGSVWEFDTSVASYDGDTLGFNHNDNVRFVNRRRFLRVPVNKPAFIAHFPFAKEIAANGSDGMKSFKMYRGPADASGGIWGPPEFFPAIVTELAGPGLRVEAALKAGVGDKVLVVFKLDEEKDQDNSIKIIQDISEVRHIEDTPNGFSIAVELIGLGDSDINTLIRATNEASLSVGVRGQNIPAPAGSRQGAEGTVSESAVVQGDAILR